MAGLFDGTTDFDDIFEPFQTGDWKDEPFPSSSGAFSHKGQSLADAFAPASAGEPGPNVGFFHGGNDIGPTYCAKGTRKDFSISSNSYNATDLALSPGTAQATTIIRFYPNGELTHETHNSAESVISGDWVRPVTSNIGDDYDIEVNLTSGDTPSGSSVNTTLSLGSTRTYSFSVSNSTAGTTETKSCDLNIVIKDSSGNTKASGNVSMEASATVEQ